MLEGDFKAVVREELEQLFPGCIILKNDANYMQGIPDMLVLFHDQWAMLEFKQKRGSRRQPNQGFFIEYLDAMSFARFISPENKEEVLYALQQSFGVRRPARLSRAQ